jgi:hypothetical protein
LRGQQEQCVPSMLSTNIESSSARVRLVPPAAATRESEVKRRLTCGGMVMVRVTVMTTKSRRNETHFEQLHSQKHKQQTPKADYHALEAHAGSLTASSAFLILREILSERNRAAAGEGMRLEEEEEQEEKEEEEEEEEDAEEEEEEGMSVEWGG